MDPQEQFDTPLIPAHTKQASFAVLYLLFFSTLMFTMPFGAFYGMKHFLMHYFSIDNNFELNAWSVFASVVTVNVIICLYAFKAFHETEYDEQGNELNPDGTLKRKED